MQLVFPPRKQVEYDLVFGVVLEGLELRVVLREDFIST